MNGEGSVQKSHLVVCFGEMLIDFVPTVSGVSLAEAPAFHKAPGGAPANVAVCVAKLGGSAAFIGKVHFSFAPYSCVCFINSLFSSFFTKFMLLLISYCQIRNNEHILKPFVDHEIVCCLCS